MDKIKPRPVIFPEATTHTGAGLLKFKKGVFLGGYQCLPYVLKYSDGYYMDYPG